MLAAAAERARIELCIRMVLRAFKETCLGRSILGIDRCKPDKKEKVRLGPLIFRGRFEAPLCRKMTRLYLMGVASGKHETFITLGLSAPKTCNNLSSRLQ